ncbi:hypothetical protein VTK73DRAFT_4771 [Phialemonium thermophilum]|uniref:Uncharacterized protein n=1 Tax=Phialemonium thermophilum TaxID=223376 RepID=A0ABR3V7V6_9PEZI
MTVPRGPLWPRTPTVLLVRVAMLLSLLLLSLGSPAAALVPPTDNPSLMIVGDSISQDRAESLGLTNGRE